MGAQDQATSYRIAYDEAVRALSQQQAEVDSFRTRAGLLLSMAAITASLLGAQALSKGHPGVVTWMALVNFVGLSISVLATLWPRKWEFTANPADVIANCIEINEPMSAAEIHRNLSLYMHRSYAKNLIGQKQLAVCFRFAGIFLTIEVMLWIADLASKG